MGRKVVVIVVVVVVVILVVVVNIAAPANVSGVKECVVDSTFKLTLNFVPFAPKWKFQLHARTRISSPNLSFLRASVLALLTRMEQSDERTNGCIP